jgi:hypothetical protein
MKAKQKAKELVAKMQVIHYVKLGGKNSESKGLPVSMYDSQVKQCALICVDEILKATRMKISWGFLKSQEKPIEYRYSEYWQEVKQELEKL